MNALLLLGVLLVQDDASTWIERLNSDLLEEREDASLRLQRMGSDVVPRLEKAREAARSPEHQARIDAVITHIRKTVELAKVFGPTRRVTLASRGRLLKEVLGDLKTPEVRVVSGALDEESRIDVQVRNGTWWEALDRTARAAKAWYTMERNEDGTFTFELKPGLPPEQPVLYVEQFRISIAEAKRVDHRTPSGRIEAAMVSVEVRYQGDLHIPFPDSEEFVRIASVLDSKGKRVLTEPREPIWMMSDSPLILCQQGGAWVDPTAALPLTVIGSTDLPFARDKRQAELALEGPGSRVTIGNATLHVQSVMATRSGLDIVLKAKAEEVPFLYERLDPSGVVLVDSSGRRHEASAQGGGNSANECHWSITFSSGIEKPRKLLVPWIADFHRVQIPFRLEGVNLPPLKP